MRNTYTLLGFTFLLIIIGAVYAFSRNVNTPAGGPADASNITSSSQGSMTASLTLTSSDFENGGSLPAAFTCDGQRINPALSISGVPEGAKSLVLIVEDPDVPKQLNPSGMFDHWTLFNIPPEMRDIAQGSTVGTVGQSSTGKNEYVAPCPPREYEPSEHRYFFKLFALDSMLSLPSGASKAEVLKAMEEHILGQAELMGRYRRQ